ncbi:hypothetical protein RJT34_09571 [Clitoria ternatea]|uniref:Cystatin domain-containing protein n=1 Tax=Clitoria ternatea TaxID=43366 RepID=A0AAN9PWG0_CLITE
MAATVTVLTVLVTLLSTLSSASCARMVGGKTQIHDVKTNKEVQELGRFAVEEYNRGLNLYMGSNNNNKLKFSEVVEAQQQVVSGIKYYMKISATNNGIDKIFSSVVVVKPWLHSKKLLHFGPSSSTTSFQ